MVKKEKAESGKRGDNAQFAEAVRESAQQIWLAGLAAFAKARADRDKLFDALVKEGRTLQARTRAIAEERIGDMSGRVSEAREKVGRQATESWDRLEQVFEDRVSRALGRLGVPSTRDVDELVRRVDEISKMLGMSQHSGPARKAPTKASKATKSAKAAKAAKAPKTAKAPKAAATRKAAKAAATKPRAKPAAKRTAATSPAAAAPSPARPS